jgi:hypothetical protein
VERMPRRAALLLIPLSLAGACRKASTESGSSSAALPPSLSGSAGCAGADQTFAPGQLPSEVVLTTTVLGPLSQVCAARDAEILYVTGPNATVYALDFSGGAPVETELVQPGTLDLLLSAAGIAQPAQLSGLAVVDGGTLYVMEHTSHVIVAVDRTAPDTVELAYGLPNTIGGNADGFGLLARFNFTNPSMLAATSDGRVYVADPGNHSIRLLQAGLVSTTAGTGAPFWADGSLQQTFFDTPTGLCFDCADHLIVSEIGGSLFSGNRIRALTLGPATFFGQQGSSATLLGDGSAASVEGVGSAAKLSSPVAPVVSETGELYWIDAGTGVLRERSSPAASALCPIDVNCTSAVGAPTFTPGATLSLALTESGVLYALDAGAAKLLRISP